MNENIPIAPLKFFGFEVFKIIMERGSSFVTATFDIQVQHFIDHLNAGNNKIFQVAFLLTITTKDEPFSLQIQAMGTFEITGEVPQEVKDNYYKIGAPSIAYPFLRAFVSNLFVQCGMQPVILPAINFAEQPIEIKYSLEQETQKELPKSE